MNIKTAIKRFSQRIEQGRQQFQRLAQANNSQAAQQQQQYDQMVQIATNATQSVESQLKDGERNFKLAKQRTNRWLWPTIALSLGVPGSILLNGHLRLSDARENHRAEVTGAMDKINGRLTALNGIPRPRMLTEAQHSTLLSSPSEQQEYLSATVPEESIKDLIPDPERRRLLLLDDRTFNLEIRQDANADLRQNLKAINDLRNRVRPIVVPLDKDPAAKYMENPWIQSNEDLPVNLYRQASDRVIQLTK